MWAFANQKGGCGKTTTAVNLAGALVAAGQRVLLIDLDPQAHATLALGRTAEQGPRVDGPGGGSAAIGEVLLGRRSLEGVMIRVSAGLTLVPSTLELARFERGAHRAMRPERALSEALAESTEHFDWILIDCPPRADGILTSNALVAATTVMLVVETGAFSLQGALRARGLLERGAVDLGTDLDLRVVATMYNRRTRFAREVLIGMQSRFGELMFDTAVRESVRLREAAGFGAPVEALDPDSRAAADFRALAAEALDYARGRSRSEGPGGPWIPNGSHSAESEVSPAGTDTKAAGVVHE